MNNDYNNNQQPQPYQQPMGISPEAESAATQAMVFGIIGLFFAGIIFGILAIVKANAAKKMGVTGGKVTAGFILGIIDIALLVVMIIFSSAILAALGFAMA